MAFINSQSLPTLSKSVVYVNSGPTNAWHSTISNCRGLGEGWERVGRGLGEGWERVGEGWERIGRELGEGWERVGRGLGEGWERVGRGWERVEGWFGTTSRGAAPILWGLRRPRPLCRQSGRNHETEGNNP